MSYTLTDILGVLPELILLVTAIAATIADLAVKGKDSSAPMMITATGFIISGLAALSGVGTIGVLMNGAVFQDGFTTAFRAIFCLIGFLTAIFSPAYLKYRNIHLGEYYALLTMAVLGMMVMVGASNLLLFFIGLETMSIAL